MIILLQFLLGSGDHLFGYRTLDDLPLLPGELLHDGKSLVLADSVRLDGHVLVLGLCKVRRRKYGDEGTADLCHIGERGLCVAAVPKLDRVVLEVEAEEPNLVTLYSSVLSNKIGKGRLDTHKIEKRSSYHAGPAEAARLLALEVVGDALLPGKDWYDRSDALIIGVAAELGRDVAFDACFHCSIDELRLLAHAAHSQHRDDDILALELLLERLR